MSSLQHRHLTSKNLSPSAAVIHLHDDALVEKYDVSSTTMVVVVVKSDDHSYSPVDINKVDGMGVC